MNKYIILIISLLLITCIVSVIVYNTNKSEKYSDLKSSGCTKDGNFPLFLTEEDAKSASPNSTAHKMGQLFMPNEHPDMVHGEYTGNAQKCVEKYERKYRYEGKYGYEHPSDNYNGLVLFDIDGTLTGDLTTIQNNEEIVQTYLDNNYAVGVVTAGGIYTPENINPNDSEYPRLIIQQPSTWMPHNLYNFMRNNDFNTFNNVRSDILLGKKETKKYKDHCDKLHNRHRHLIWGWKKGLAMKETALHYNIYDSTKVILYDDQPSFLQGAKLFDPEFKTFCAGRACNGRFRFLSF
jgi:hypothetical protein